MAEVQINSFADIDYDLVDVATDILVLPSGDKFRFSDQVCHNCWAGGTVVESVEGEKKHFYCLLCQNWLRWRQFTNDFIPPVGDQIKFLLPEKWNQSEISEWFAEYREARLAQENVKERILQFGK